MRLMSVITFYLYGSIDNDIYLKIPEIFRLLEENNTRPRSMCLIKSHRSLYGLKQSEHVLQSFIERRVCKQPYMPMHLYQEIKNRKPDLQLLLCILMI